MGFNMLPGAVVPVSANSIGQEKTANLRAITVFVVWVVISGIVVLIVVIPLIVVPALIVMIVLVVIMLVMVLVSRLVRVRVGAHRSYFLLACLLRL